MKGGEQVMTVHKMDDGLDEDAVKRLRKLQQRDTNPYKFILVGKEKTDIKQNSIYNIERILEIDPILKDSFQYNDFTSEIDVIKDIPTLHIKQGYMIDDYYTEIASYIEKSSKYQHILFDDRRIRNAVLVVAREHHYNPIIDYMKEALKQWDHTPRLDTVLYTYLGVEPTEIVAYITKLFFTGVVAKIFNPKTKFDYVLDLVGGQGAGKTTFLQKIAPLGYYTDQFTSFDNKDDYAVMRRAVIINDDEMTATANASFETLKKFITLQEFEYRKPYGHQAERFAKHFVMARTTNELYYLKDKTGERRFLPVMVNRDRQLQNPVEDLTPEVVQQLWGEAVDLYQNQKFSFKIDDQMQQQLDEHRESFMYTDEIEDRIEELLSNELRGFNFITSKKIGELLDIDLNREHKIANRISNIMINRFHFKKGNKRVDGQMTRGYLR